jgi:cytochrome c oxidase subunit 2
LAVLVFGALTFILAPSYGMWLPQDASAHGADIDSLYYFILILTGVVFIATEGVLFYFMWKYDAKSNPEPVVYSHGSHTLEIVWTIIPAATLLFIAIYQFNVWADTKMRNPMWGVDRIEGNADDMDPTIEVTARQWEWRLRYPGKDGKLGTPDDLFTVNEMHVPVVETEQDLGEVVSLKSADILHSFFLPELRVKQDAVPGMNIPVWFKPVKIGEYDLVCAEHCGARHYAMKGKLIVESKADYARWLEKLATEQFRTQASISATQVTSNE